MQLNTSEYENNLIFGKEKTERITNLEVCEDKVICFIEDENGNVYQEQIPNRWWILSNRRLHRTSHKLQGSLYYQYGTQFNSKEEWSKCLHFARKKNEDVYAIWNPTEAAQVKDGICCFKGMKHTEPSALSFDIESTGLFHNDDSKVLLISNTFRKAGVITRKLFAYDDYENQGEMLTAWCNWVREVDPSLIIGHNIYTYDIPYLNFVAESNGVQLLLGRDGSNIEIKSKPSQFRVDGSRSQEYHKVHVWGRDCIDTMFLAIKYDVAAKKYDSYGLKSIIKTEGIEKSDRVMYDASQIRFNYKNPVEWEKIKQYCEHDADDSLALYDLMGASLFYATQSVPKTFQGMLESATGAQINAIMVRSYLQEGHSLPKSSEVHPFKGAISIGSPGIYSNCIKFDVASLYPSIMRECKVYDPDKDPKAHFLQVLEFFAVERLKNKRIAKETGDRYYKDLEQSQKIFANSMYGFLSTQGILFNFPEGAEFVTKTGRDILVTAIEWATGQKYEE